MSRKLLLTLLVSISAHVAAVIYLSLQEAQPRTIAMGSIKAPVSMTFSTVSNPVETSKPVPPEPEKEPEPIKEPEKPLPEPVKNSKPVLKKSVEKIEKKPEPKKEAVKPKPEPEKTEKVEKKKEKPAPEQVQMAKSATVESEAEGLSNDPVQMVEPSIINQVQPTYPSRYRRRSIEGTVKLELIVNESGQVITVSIVESSGYKLMDQSAITAVRQWTFKPEQRKGRYVKSRLQLPVVFKINRV